MKHQQLFFASNVRKLRKRKNLSQEELSNRLSMTRSKLALLESGKTLNPPLEDLLSFSDVFGIGVDTLLKVNLQKLAESEIKELEAGNDIYTTGTNIRVLATTVDKDNVDNVEFVPEKAKAGYRNGYGDPEWIAELPRYSIPGLSKHSKYRIFPISGDSMLPYPDGCQIIGEYLEDWTKIKDDTLCILILKNGEADIVFKQIENRIKKEKKILAKSLNILFQPYEIPVEDVIEIWVYKAHIACTMISHHNEIPSAHILQVMLEMKLEISKLSAALK
ncbi:XRE family transcriptional regulator [Mucilaginibacter lutimaris]|uniref:XRE family transcriptional regulator n=1 Tax=Mucilaginibacter lutimaris TaxID=931629 RepID=A0ABW2ZL41_9SPHI